MTRVVTAGAVVLAGSLVLAALGVLAGCAWGSTAPRHEQDAGTRIALTDGWMLHREGETNGIPAQVPGLVQQTLLEAGVIPDPYVGTNEEDVRWVEECAWEYRVTTSVSPELLDRDRIELVFDGLDTYAEVFVNGERVLSAENMFRRYRADVTGKLQLHDNAIRVVFTPPMQRNRSRVVERGHALPADNDHGEVRVAVETRKAPFQFGWDWAPRLVTMGIWRPVWLVGSRAQAIEGVVVRQGERTPERATMDVRLRVRADGASGGTVELRVDGEDAARARQDVELAEGMTEVRIPLEIPAPELWWPAGHGAQRLYALNARLLVDGDVVSSEATRFGIRDVELRQTEDERGTAFEFVVNDRPVFLRGANYVPQDSLLTRVQPTDHRWLLEQARAANMNALRVWGGGIYEDDAFYRTCDELGILVWQDFMFACSMYPGDAAFTANVLAEVEDNVRRLQNHPSLALWCGNNEIEVGWKNWGWQATYGYSDAEAGEMWGDYTALFHGRIPSLLTDLDPDRPYVPTSPLSNWGKPENFGHSSMHYWGVWHGREPFANYRTNVGRFMSEYGFQSFPAMATLRTFAAEDDLALDSPVMRHHQKSGIGSDLVQVHLERRYPRPRTFDDLVYLSQLSQAYGVGLAITNHRMAAGHCAGTLYWQLNDCWPGPSWSSIDYQGRWKKLHYTARDLFAPATVLVDEAAEGRIRVVVANDRAEALRGRVRLSVMALDATTVRRLEDLTVDVPPGTSHAVTDLDRATLFDASTPPTEHVLRATLEQDGRTIAERTWHACAPKQLRLTDPHIRRSIAPVPNGFAITLTASAYALDVFVETDEPRTNPSDNFFELWPGVPRTVTIETARDRRTFERGLRIRSLFDTFGVR